MARPVSVLDEQAIDPFLAGLALERLDARAREALAGAVAALLAALVLAALALWPVAVAALCGAVAGAVLASDARSDRQALIDRLVRQRSAYGIERVERRGRHLATFEARHHAARLLGRLLVEADGFAACARPLRGGPERLREARDDVLAVLFGLVDPATSVHPSAIALLGRLLSLHTSSPLHDERVPAEHVRLALRRIQLGFETAEAEPERLAA